VLLANMLFFCLLVRRARRRRAEAQIGTGEKLRRHHEPVRHLGARLLDEQDTERSRIARELHDDIGQQLAVLSIDLEMLRRAEPHESEPLVEDALSRAADAARSVRDLSRRLHPAKLQLVGLVAAVQALQQELSVSSVTFVFTHQDVPSELPPALTLAVFRIIEEAVQNAVMHSGAGTITVQVRGEPAALELTVSDDGAGFDVRAARAHGLGLVRTAERVQAIGGVLDIQSAPGAGTTVRVRVPLAAGPDVDFSQPSSGRRLAK
jgi:signal transduction histidine kinase